jgi:hypothetical protein
VDKVVVHGFQDKAWRAASNWLSGSQTLLRGGLGGNGPKETVSEVAVEAKSVTGRSVKNQVNIELTRLNVMGTPASRAMRAVFFSRPL